MNRHIFDGVKRECPVGQKKKKKHQMVLLEQDLPPNSFKPFSIPIIRPRRETEDSFKAASLQLKDNPDRRTPSQTKQCGTGIKRIKKTEFLISSLASEVGFDE